MSVPKPLASRLARWNPAEESDELVFAVCDRYFYQLGQARNDAAAARAPAARAPVARARGGAAAVAEWVQREMGRPDITRERIYPLFGEACQRGFLLLQPPLERALAQKLVERFALEDHRGEITVVNFAGHDAARHVTSVAADTILTLIEQVHREKKERFPNEPERHTVHLGMGAGFVTMLVAQRLAHKINSGEVLPRLVFHAISAGGFTPHEPHKAPSNYFTYFDPTRSGVEFVALFAETVVRSEDYAKLKDNPSIRIPLERREEVDIVITSLAAADHQHGLLVQYLGYLSEQGLLDPHVLEAMTAAGWIGDVQFHPYSAERPLDDLCPLRAVTLFDIDDLVSMACDAGSSKRVVLVAGPCGECEASKHHALAPLLANPRLRLWTDLITDAHTARRLLES